MTITRRDVLKAGAAVSLFGCLPSAVRAASMANIESDASWRTFEVTTRLELPGGEASSAWIPVPSFADDEWIQPGSSGWSTNASTATMQTLPGGAKVLWAQWPRTVSNPVMELRTRVSTRDHGMERASAGAARPLSADERQRYLAGTRFVPVDGIIGVTAERITAGADDELQKVRRIYEWMVANTYRNPVTRGCGNGDAVAVLNGGGGKCADINALFVGMVRASGIPARELYGIRTAPSARGYYSLGASGDVTAAQHCRAEVYLSDFGWVPMDPADVTKVVLEEPGEQRLRSAKIEAARRMLFGGWETNWVAYNDLRDVALSESVGPQLPFLMYPQAEVAGARLDCYDSNAFRYRITSAEIAA